METLKIILSISFCICLLFMFLIVVSYMMQEYKNQKPIRRHKKIQKIIARAKPVDRGYSTPEGYCMKIELMDMRGELENYDHANH